MALEEHLAAISKVLWSRPYTVNSDYVEEH